MNRKSLILAALAALMLVSFACSRRTPSPEPPTATPRPTLTPRPTATPLPPKPVVAYTPVPADELSPIVIQRHPQPGERVAPDGTVEIMFDKAMDKQAVAGAFSLRRAGEAASVSGDLSWPDARTLRFEPQQPLPRDTVYDVILTQNAVAEGGEPLREPYTFRFATAGYLEVTQVIPAPETIDVETDATITVMFNRPVVPLTSLQQMEDLPDPLTFEPAIAGEGEWLNTSIYVFTPAEPLAGGVSYRATVTQGVQDVAGAVLAEDYTWHFTTVPPKVSWVSPSDGKNLVDIETVITVRFNQPVDPASAQRAFNLASGRLLGTSTEGTFAIEGATLIFTPTRPLDFNTSYSVQVDAGVTSAAGGEGMRIPFSAQFTTVPLPEIVSTTPRHQERNAPPRTAFQIEFNAPIDPTTVMPNLTMTPPLSPTQVYTYFSPYNNTFILHFGAEPSSEYTVVIDDGIADPYGNTIPRGRTVRFRTAPLDPAYRLRVPEQVGTYDAALPAQVVLAHLNLTRVDLRLYRLPLSALHTDPWRWRDEGPPSGSDLLREWQVRLESPLNEQRYTAVGLTEATGGTLSPGVYLLNAEAPELDKDDYQYRQQHVLVVSNLNLTLKTAPEAGMVWATDLADGAPVAGLALRAVDYEGREIATATTDGDGIARMDVPRHRNRFVVYAEDPFVAVAEGWGRGINPWDFGVGQGTSAQDYRTYIYTDRPIYRPGQVVHFKGALRAEDDADFSMPGIDEVRVTIRDAAHEELFNETLSVSEMGTFAGELALEEGAALGQYWIGVDFADQHAQTVFQVAEYRPPEFEVTVATPADAVQRGEDVDATIQASYYFGGPLADAPAEWNVIASRYVFEPPWGGRYSFDDVDDPYVCYRCWWWIPEPEPTEPILSGAGQTDAAGELPLTLEGDALEEALRTWAKDTPPPRILDSAAEPEEADTGRFPAARLTIEATITGPDNQPISGRTDVIVHPGPYYIGLSPQTYVSQAGEESRVDLVVVDWGGERLPDKEIQVEFYRREWINTFVETAYGGYWDWETEETLVDTVTVSTDELGEAVAAFVPPEGGSYHVVATPASPTPETEAIRSSIFIWVAGESYVPWRRQNHDRITLVSDKTTYEVGETAEILIPAPFDGPFTALVTVEREGVRRHEVLRFENNSPIYRLPITEGDVPNIYVSVVLVKGRAGGEAEAGELASFKMGLLPLDVTLAPVKLNVQVEADVEQAQPGEDVTYTVIATGPDGTPASGAELSLDLVDKAVLSLRPRTQDIVQGFYARRALQVNTASGLSVSVNRYLQELAESVDIVEQKAVEEVSEMEFAADEAMEAPAAAPTMVVAEGAERAAGGGPPEGVEIREEFADTAFWAPTLVTDAEGRASVTVTLPDNLTTWTARAVALNRATEVGEGTTDLVATKPLLVRPVAPRFFVVDDRAQLAANVSNNTDSDLEVEVGLSAEGVSLGDETPAQQTVTIPARSERKVTWWVTVADVTQAELIFSAVSGDYSDASKPRLTTGPDNTLLVLRYTTPDIVGTAGQLAEGGSRTEAIALPPVYDERQGHLTVQLDPSLAAGMQDGLTYLEHYEYECTEQTVSRFLPNILTYDALQSLGIEAPELAERLPDLVQEGLDKLYRQQNPDGGWGWWHRAENWHSNPHVSAYVVFGLVKAQQTGWSVKAEVLDQGVAYLLSEVQAVSDYEHYRQANRQAWLLYVLAEAGAAPQATLDELYEHRDKLSTYARAYLAQALWLRDADDARLATLLSDINNAAILSATGAHWEEANYDWWAMNTDTRSTAIVLDTLVKLDPENALAPNAVRWLMVAREAGIWETTQETAWALIALTDWMLYTGELDADYEFALYLNDEQRTGGIATRETIRESVETQIPIAELRADVTNALSVARTEGPGRLYYTAHLEVYQPVENVEPADRGFIVERRYTLASCEAENRLDCPEVREVQLGDVIRVDLTLIVPHDRYYVMVEDPLPAGGEAIDTGLATTSLLALDPSLRRQDSRYWWWWRWYSRSELRDEKVVLFADVLAAGTYEYSYTFRATLPGDYHVMPTVAQEFYFPEVFGRSDGRLLTIGE